jgi:5'/3'-nucleotidase SurE
MEKNVPLILISNDDGYHAKGFRELIGMVRDMGYVIACAPEAHRSGASCAFSPTIPLTLKLRHKEDGVEVWSPFNTEEQTEMLAAFCKKEKLLLTGGSNFHGTYGEKTVTIGAYTTPQEHLDKLMTYKASRKRAQKKAEKEAALKAQENA